MSDADLDTLILTNVPAVAAKSTALRQLPTKTLESLEAYCIKTARAVARELGRRDRRH